MHVLGFATVYVAHIYMFTALIYIVTCIYYAACMQTYANICKCMLYCISLLVV